MPGWAIGQTGDWWPVSAHGSARANPTPLGADVLFRADVGCVNSVSRAVKIASRWAVGAVRGSSMEV